MKKRKSGVTTLVPSLTLITVFCLIPKTIEESPQKEIASAKIIVEKPKLVIPQALLDIAKCESGDKQFNKDGTVKRGEINNKDIGRWQINEKYWLKKSQELGFDIYTPEGNLQMGLWIYNNYGVKPWSWSASCHGHY